ncbi:hypothetical protein ACA910_005336 [Epithemia clementina (nom. ined.)]
MTPSHLLATAVVTVLLLDLPMISHGKALQNNEVPAPASAFWSSDALKEKSVYFKNDLPNNYWSLDEDGSGFMPAADPETLTYMQNYHASNMEKLQSYNAKNINKQENHRDLSSSSTSSSSASFSTYSSGSSGGSTSRSPYSNYFVDGLETFWSEGAQAWRLLGFYIDCYEVEKGYEDRRRNLNDHNEDNQEMEYGACVRYLLWAAYIDVYYEGGGIGEYMFWDKDYNAWDTTACDEMAQYNGDSNRRCAKMDCHLQGSNHFKLLGFFKEPNFAQFYEQLFKHAGICLWDEDTYDFMQTMREVWPSGCTNSGVTDGNDLLYFDVKPIGNADLSIGLYTDERCSVDYQGQENTADVLAAYSSNNGNNNDHDENSMTIGDLYYYMDYWNSAMASFKLCQPCKSYEKLYGNCEQDETQNKDYSDDDSKGHFTCEDDAGYKNVNQCMKFATHTRMMAATFRDVLIGANQGTIMPVYVGHISVRPGAYTTSSSQWRTSDFMAVGLSSLFFIASAAVFYQSWKRAQESTATQEHRVPLVLSTSSGAYD